MKVEISKNQNTLTVDGIKYEANLNDAWPYKPSCKSCAFWVDGFLCKIAVEAPLGINARDVRRCEHLYRNDGKTIYWIKKEQKMKEVKPHVHAELIKKWADDANQNVWYFETELKKWTKWSNDSVMWLSSHQYAVGEMPTEPPVKMVKYEGGTIEFPEPLKEKPTNGKPYFFATLGGIADSVFWHSQEHHVHRLELGTVHMAKSDALKQHEALKELLKNQIKKWS